MGQQWPECVAATFQRKKSPVDPALPMLGVSPSSTCHHCKLLQDTSPIPRTCSSFSSICSTSVVLRVVKQEASSKGFATIYIMSGEAPGKYCQGHV